MRSVRRGSADGLGALYDRYSGVAFSLASGICRQRAMAEDVVQEAFLAIWRSGGSYDAARGSVQTYVLSIVRHRAIDALRRVSVHERRRADGEGWEWRLAGREPERTHDEAMRLGEATALRIALRELPDHQRTVVELAYYGGMTHREIASITHAPLGTVKGRMRLAVAKLGERLAAEGLAEAAGL